MDGFHCMSLLAEFLCFIALWISESAKELCYAIRFRSRPTKDIGGAHILITGTAQGLGREISRLLAHNGNTLHLVDINTEQNELVREELEERSNCTVFAYHCDIAREDSVSKLCEQVHQNCPKLDYLINNAGIVIGKLFLDESLKEFRFAQDVNVMGAVQLTKAFLPDFLGSNGGHIVCISSLSGHVGAPFLTSYCTSKHAITGFIRNLQEDFDYLGLSKIKLTAVYPNFFNSGIVEGCTVKIPQLFPLMEQSWVAAQVVTAIREEREEVFLPKILGPMMALRHVMTTKVFRRFCQLMGNDMMKTFRQTRTHNIH